MFWSARGRGKGQMTVNSPIPPSPPVRQLVGVGTVSYAELGTVDPEQSSTKRWSKCQSIYLRLSINPMTYHSTNLFSSLHSLIVKPQPGSLRLLFNKINNINQKNAPFDLLICLSDLFWFSWWCWWFEWLRMRGWLRGGVGGIWLVGEVEAIVSRGLGPEFRLAKRWGDEGFRELWVVVVVVVVEWLEADLGDFLESECERDKTSEGGRGRTLLVLVIFLRNQDRM